jgi:hypothetical protein
MKRIKALAMAGLFAVALLLTSCDATSPLMVTNNKIGSKVGKASGTCYLWAICLGADWSLQKACENGGITKVATVDYHLNNVLGIIVTHETIVTGE